MGSLCNKCIAPLLSRGCPVRGSVNNAACLTLYKDRNNCKKEECITCKWYKYCKEEGLNKNKGDTMKVFLSHKMSGVSDEEVYRVREEATNYLKGLYGENIEIIDNYHHDDAPEDAGRLWHLGRSIQQLQEADVIYFCDGHDDTNGCKVEKLIVELYGIKVLNPPKGSNTDVVNKYKTKHCEVEAVQWLGFNLSNIESFVNDGSLNCSIVDATHGDGKAPRVDISINTLEGTMNASINDYIIKGLNGEFYPCKPDIFEKKYDII